MNELTVLQAFNLIACGAILRRTVRGGGGGVSLPPLLSLLKCAGPKQRMVLSHLGLKLVMLLNQFGKFLKEL